MASCGSAALNLTLKGDNIRRMPILRRDQRRVNRVKLSQVYAELLTHHGPSSPLANQMTAGSASPAQKQPPACTPAQPQG